MGGGIMAALPSHESCIYWIGPCSPDGTYHLMKVAFIELGHAILMVLTISWKLHLLIWAIQPWWHLPSHESCIYWIRPCSPDGTYHLMEVAFIELGHAVLMTLTISWKLHLLNWAMQSWWHLPSHESCIYWFGPFSPDGTYHLMKVAFIELGHRALMVLTISWQLHLLNWDIQPWWHLPSHESCIYWIGPCSPVGTYHLMKVAFIELGHAALMALTISWKLHLLNWDMQPWWHLPSHDSCIYWIGTYSPDGTYHLMKVAFIELGHAVLMALTIWWKLHLLNWAMQSCWHLPSHESSIYWIGPCSPDGTYHLMTVAFIELGHTALMALTIWWKLHLLNWAMQPWWHLPSHESCIYWFGPCSPDGTYHLMKVAFIELGHAVLLALTIAWKLHLLNWAMQPWWHLPSHESYIKLIWAMQPWWHLPSHESCIYWIGPCSPDGTYHLMSVAFIELGHTVLMALTISWQLYLLNWAMQPWWHLPSHESCIYWFGPCSPWWHLPKPALQTIEAYSICPWHVLLPCLSQMISCLWKTSWIPYCSSFCFLPGTCDKITQQLFYFS